ncbi:pyridoxal-phosphate dependent enzyme [Ktedonosporobacter rubrisoli]|uniref:Pyridoxal-phosphate dependent enzyme n=1 Tax=Ktedonosporobacter rubrisoli TaxID=2509675 RepID=A0A4P6JQF4_KTERU|nr:pyridoxal-phosphate dependent enzyme [Ktedonosporobacter rubrisoli]QBD77639.1 pyridoxal-phosphate dependent enzyme [Ktedonosporobacter rubrisoli]
MSISTVHSRLSLERIEAASRIIDPIFTNTPQFRAEKLEPFLGSLQLVVKVETINPIGSFKGRGTDYFVSQLKEPMPIVCASSGNFGQGLAYATRKRNYSFTVFAAENANPRKVKAMQRLGAQVQLVGKDFDAAKLTAAEYAQQTGAYFVEDGREAAVTEGMGSIAVELTRWPQPFDTVLVPLGNGALINGIGRWFKAHSPHTQIIGVSPTGSPAMERSWRSNTLVTLPQIETVADGIGIRTPVPEALEDMKGLIDDILLVDDQALIEAVRLLYFEMGLLVEPSGAAGLAAAMVFKERFADQLVATPLCGSNLSLEQQQSWLWTC